MNSVYQNADVGAKSAWKGYSSQTLYIAYRIAGDSTCQVEREYYPEHIEDLLIKQNGRITEVVQVKDLSTPLSLSSLASTKDSKNKTGFFRRACSLMGHDVKAVRVVYFGELGAELAGFRCGKGEGIKVVQQKLVDNHGLSSEEATWLSKTLIFEKVEHRVLKDELLSHLSTTVPTMSFPELAFSLLTQHVADLSQTGGFTSIQLWQDKILSIGHSIAAVDGFYKEYGKSLIRLSEFATDETADKLSEEYKAGVSAHPEHIRMGLDFIREYWINAIEEKINKRDIIVVKGASGQGKTSLCLRYLMNHCPEDLVFCVRHAKGSTQINNLARSISEISKYISDMMLYIDVYPGEYEWPKLLLELKALGTNIPILVSIREEDFKQSIIDYAAISIKLVELDLTEKEAEIIYKNYTENEPHPIYRSFIEAWGAFGGKGPFMEFVYLLNNNQTLFDRLQSQIKQLMLEEHPDSWFVLLSIVCYAGRVGCAVLLSDAVHVSGCDASISALNRMTNEYLIKTTDDNKYLEALHPVRAKAICEILTPDSPLNVQELFSSTIRCVNHRGLQLLVMDYFTYNPHHPDVINALLALPLRNWTTAAAVLRSLLWVSTKEYYETNQSVFQSLLEKRGDGWMMFSPMDISGLLSPGKLIMESVVDSMPESSLDKNAVRKEIDETKDSLSSFTIDYSQVDKWIGSAQFPECYSETGMDWDDFSYVLYWCAQRKRILDLSPYK